MRRRNRIVALVMALLAAHGGLCIAALPSVAADTVIQSAAEIDYPPFSIVTENGRAGGFSVELMRAALAAMGRQVTFRTGPWAEVRTWLEKGTVQALPLVGRTPEREPLFDFTFPYMTLHGAIVVRSENTDIRSLEDLRGRQVAVMKGDNAEEFLRREDRGIDIVSTPTFDIALRALSEGRHDAVFIQKLVALRLIQASGLKNLRIVPKPVAAFRQDFCFAVTEGDRETLALLNEGLALVMADGTYRHLHAKWFAALELPADRKIVVGGDHDYPPYEFLDAHGHAVGFNAALTRAIAKEMGLDIEIRLGPWAKMVAGLENGTIDVLMGMFYSPDRDLTFDFSPPHASNQYVSVVKKGKSAPPTTVAALKGMRIAVQKGDVIYEWAVRNGLGEQVSFVETQEALLRGVRAGAYDCGLTIRMTTLYLIERYEWRDLDLGSRPFLSMDACYAVRNSRKALLAQFSEGLHVLENTGEYQRIYNKWLGIYNPSGPDAVTVIRTIAVVAVPLLVVVLVVFLWSWSLRKQIAIRTSELSERERQYRLLADNTLDVIWTMNLDLVFTYVNPAVTKLTGYLPEEWVGSRLADHCDEQNFDNMAQIIADEMTVGEGSNGVIFEAEMLRKDGSVIWVEIHGNFLFDDDGKLVSLQGVTRDISGRKKTEAALHEARHILQAAMDNSPAGIAIADAPDGTLRYVNDAGLFIRGEARSRVVNGVGLDQYVASWQLLDLDGTPLDTDQVPLARAVRLGETCSREFMIRRGDGDDRIVLANAAPVRDASGKITAGIVVFLDITERKRAEEKLRLRENQYNAIVENSGDFVMRFDRQHRHIFANHRAIEATGRSREQFLGRTAREMGFPEHLCAMWEKNIDAVFSTGEVRTVDFDIELKGAWMSLELQLNPEFDEGGRVRSVIGVSRDVTERKLAHREDRLNKARLEILYQIRDLGDASEKAICDMALEKMVALSNSEIGYLGFIVDDERIMQIHAWSASAMANCAVHDKPMAFPIDQAGLWGEPVRRRQGVIINDYAVPHPAKRGCPEGHVAISRFMSVPVLDGDRIVAVAAVANKAIPYDRIDQNQLDLLMSSVWVQIQRRRAEREKDTLLTQLQKAQKMESLGSLAGGIAHDFNNLLFPIVGLSELLLEDLPKDSQEYGNVLEIFNAGKRGSDLVKQILAFSRQSENRKLPVRIQQILKEVLKLCRSSIPSDIVISQDIQSDCGLVNADPTQIHQIGMNLITNAFHAMTPTGGVITVQLKEARREDGLPDGVGQPSKWVKLTVSDTGCGIPEQLIEKIFEPYFTTKAQGKGTGLGLAVVYGIVKEHGGKIDVRSAVGSGTTFDVYLPLLEKPAEQIPDPAVDQYPCGSESILLVDDEEPIIQFERQMLERLGYRVTTRLSSNEALAAFKSAPDNYDLLITDMTMPNMTGDKLAIEVMRIKPEFPVIVCTGFSERLDKERAAAIGIKGFLLKPVGKSDMAETIRSILDAVNDGGQ